MMKMSDFKCTEELLSTGVGWLRQCAADTWLALPCITSKDWKRILIEEVLEADIGCAEDPTCPFVVCFM
jgi:hypothetical protein